MLMGLALFSHYDSHLGPSHWRVWSQAPSVPQLCISCSEGRYVLHLFTYWVTMEECLQQASSAKLGARQCLSISSSVPAPSNTDSDMHSTKIRWREGQIIKCHISVKPCPVSLSPCLCLPYFHVWITPCVCYSEKILIRPILFL